MLGEILKKAEEWCAETEQLVKAQIDRKRLNSSGNLKRSVKCYAEETDNGKINIVYEMWDYGYYQDEGVKGKNPRMIPNGRGRQKAPRSKFKFGSGTAKGSLSKALDLWIVRKRIAPRNKQGKFMSRKSLKFLIARSIYYQGIEPKKFFKPVWDKQLKELQPMLQAGLINEIDKQWYERIYSKNK